MTLSSRLEPRSVRTCSTPERKWMKNVSMVSRSDGRERTSPITPVSAPDRARALLLGYQPRSFARSSTRCLVAELTPGCPLSAYDTAALEMSRRWAISPMVARGVGPAIDVSCAISALLFLRPRRRYGFAHLSPSLITLLNRASECLEHPDRNGHRCCCPPRWVGLVQLTCCVVMRQ